jgi:hypothetical protein
MKRTRPVRMMRTSASSAPEPRGPETLAVEYEGVRLEGEWEIAGRELRVRIDGNGSAILFRNDNDPASAARDCTGDAARLWRW